MQSTTICTAETPTFSNTLQIKHDNINLKMQLQSVIKSYVIRKLTGSTTAQARGPNKRFWTRIFRTTGTSKNKSFFFVPFDIFPTRCNITQFIYFWKTALHVSGGISTHHQEHTQLYLQYLVLVKPLLLPAAIVEELELV